MESAVKEIICSDWDDFASKVTKTVNRHIAGQIYRGHAVPEWKLSSIWERVILENKTADKTRDVRLCDLFLERFKELAVGIPGLDTHSINSKNEWWALARHHGLVTPLLDWTRSPFIAAFFAFSDYAEILSPGFKQGLCDFKPLIYWNHETNHNNKYVAVWALSVPHELIKRCELEIISDCKDNFHRQRAQQGLFTLLEHDRINDIESYLAECEFSNLLECFLIPAIQTFKALHCLGQMNINFSTLFPDLNGAALQANVAQTIYSYQKGID